VRAATGDVADDLLTYLQAHEVPILVCTPCAKARQIKEEDLIEGSRMATAAEFINMSCDAAVISL
jgi:sulfur relay (sulfurtransferase) complex TusBCD TusD component (DsrE family)